MNKEKEKLLVKKSNKSIEYKLETMTIQELKIMNLVISMIDNSKKVDEVTEEDLLFKITKTELLNYLDIVELRTKRFQSDMKKLSKKQIEYIKNEEFTFLNIFSYISYSNSILSIQINKDIIDYFVELSKQFTQYYYKYIVSFKSKYTLLMYELLKKDKYKTSQHNNKQILVYDLEYLFDKLQVESKSMQIYNRFKEKILEVVKKEINEHSDLYFSYKEKKVGRKVVSIEITKLHNKNKSVEESESNEVIENKGTSVIDFKEAYEEEKKRTESLQRKNKEYEKVLDIENFSIPVEEDIEEDSEYSEDLELAVCF